MRGVNLVRTLNAALEALRHPKSLAPPEWAGAPNILQRF